MGDGFLVDVLVVPVPARIAHAWTVAPIGACAHGVEPSVEDRVFAALLEHEGGEEGVFARFERARRDFGFEGHAARIGIGAQQRETPPLAGRGEQGHAIAPAHRRVGEAVPAAGPALVGREPVVPHGVDRIVPHAPFRQPVEPAHHRPGALFGRVGPRLVAVEQDAFVGREVMGEGHRARRHPQRYARGKAQCARRPVEGEGEGGLVGCAGARPRPLDAHRARLGLEADAPSRKPHARSPSSARATASPITAKTRSSW